MGAETTYDLAIFGLLIGNECSAFDVECSGVCFFL